MDDLITVIVPIYNVEKYLSKCLQSILEQTYRNLEIILVNDGSTDSSGDICEYFKKKDNRVKVIHKKNGGQGQARNVGINIASGKYLGFIDSDDWIENDMYESLYNALINNNADMSLCGLNYIYKNTVVTKDAYNKLRIIDNEELIKMYFTKDTIISSPCNKLYKRDIFDKIRYPETGIFEDRYISLELFSMVNRAVHIGVPRYNYLQRDGSTVHRPFDYRDMILLDITKNERKFIQSKYPHMESLALESTCKAAITIIKVISATELSKNSKEYLDVIQILKKELKELEGKIPSKNLKYYNRVCKYKMLYRIYRRTRYIIGKIITKLFPQIIKRTGQVV